MTTIALTGASGRIGTALRPLLAAPGRTLRLLDLTEPDGLVSEHEEFVEVSVTDDAGLRKALEGVDALVHLAGYPSEREWRDILETNIHGTYVALESARAAGVSHVFLASSVHALGTSTFAEVARHTEPNPRPDTFYGVSKATMEALGSVYAARYGMSIVSARICHFGVEEGTGRDRLLWLSPGDAARLVEATLALPQPGHHVVWAVSRNARPWMRPEAGEAIGFVAQDGSADPDRSPEDALAAEGLAETDLLGAEFAAEEHPPGRPFE